MKNKKSVNDQSFLQKRLDEQDMNKRLKEHVFFKLYCLSHCKFPF